MSEGPTVELVARNPELMGLSMGLMTHPVGDNPKHPTSSTPNVTDAEDILKGGNPVLRPEVPDAPVYDVQEGRLVPLVITGIVGSHCDKGRATEDLVRAETNLFTGQGNRELRPSGRLARDVAGWSLLDAFTATHENSPRRATDDVARAIARRLPNAIERTSYCSPA